MSRQVRTSITFCDSCQRAISPSDEDRMTLSVRDQTVLLCGQCARLIAAVLEDMHIRLRLHYDQ